MSCGRGRWRLEHGLVERRMTDDVYMQCETRPAGQISNFGVLALCPMIVRGECGTTQPVRAMLTLVCRCEMLTDQTLIMNKYTTQR